MDVNSTLLYNTFWTALLKILALVTFQLAFDPLSVFTFDRAVLWTTETLEKVCIYSKINDLKCRPSGLFYMKVGTVLTFSKVFVFFY